MPFNIFRALSTGSGPEYNQLIIYFNSRSPDAPRSQISGPPHFVLRSLSDLLRPHGMGAGQTMGYLRGRDDELRIMGINAENFDRLVTALEGAGFAHLSIMEHVIPLRDEILRHAHLRYIPTHGDPLRDMVAAWPLKLCT